MLPRHNDPIAAIATAPGRGAVGIVRVSGKGWRRWCGCCAGATSPREATYLPLRDAAGGPIDHGLALFFPAPHSYTGEDVLELQAHGGPVVLQLLLARCLEAAQEPLEGHRSVLPGLRLAQPGEFTERAFLNDKIDLAQAEAIADLIDASTEAARAARAARCREPSPRRSMACAMRWCTCACWSRPRWTFPRKRSTSCKRPMPAASSRGCAASWTRCCRAPTRVLLREGIKVVIAGQPNAGKSSLLNALAGAELAIVTPIAGTTRDKVQQTIQIEGVPLHVIDTAGLRESSDEVERIGIARAWEEIAAADAVLFLHDLTRMGDNDYLAADAAIAETLAQKLPGQVPVIDVWNKTDRAEPAQLQAHGGREGSVALSARTGDGLDALRRRLLDVAGWQSAPKACTWRAHAMWRRCRPWPRTWKRPSCSWRPRPPIWTCWPRNCAWPRSR